jgi:hypothetical protein
MKQYSIPIIWQSYKRFDVDAETLEDAVAIALKQFFSEPCDMYLEDSFEIDNVLEEEYPDEDYDLNKILSKI